MSLLCETSEYERAPPLAMHQEAECASVQQTSIFPPLRIARPFLCIFLEGRQTTREYSLPLEFERTYRDNRVLGIFTFLYFLVAIENSRYCECFLSKVTIGGMVHHHPQPV